LGGSSVIWLKIWKPKKVQSLPKVIDTAFYPIFKYKVLLSTFYEKMLQKYKKITKTQTFVW
jgi:hypothetical protein